MEDRLLCKASPGQVKESQKLVDSGEDQELCGQETEGGTGKISGRQVFNGSDIDSL